RANRNGMATLLGLATNSVSRVTPEPPVHAPNKKNLWLRGGGSASYSKRDMNRRQQAIAFNDQGAVLQERGRVDRVAARFRQAIAADPSWGVPWYNLGLVHKRQRNWPKTLRCNLRATELDPTNEAAWWNLGIAATALGRWRIARSAWRGFGIDV